ncbi:MAG: N-acetylmuramoyl-L-alanine amidase [Verrucomicrobia subdivision 3 bacterium]|nr:N-acetylmuramoyl-L-alanine amidase [Limisphaerales bacterium]
MSHQRTTYRAGRGRKRWGLLLALVVACAAPGREQSYVVKPKDTLSGVAQRHGLSVSQLANRNGISHTGQLYVGQRLLIPGTAASDSKSASSPLGPTLAKAINNAPVKGGRWQAIVIHHAAVDEGSVKSLDRYHREQRHMENGLAYHFLIGNGNGMGDGEIAVGNRWKKQLDGGHLRSEAQNQTALGICLIGDFNKHPPTARQLRSLEDLVRALMRRCQLDAGAVKTHQQINVVHTQCPGSKFPTRAFLARLKSPAG